MKSFALAFSSVLLVFTFFEVGLRLAGHEPWRPQPLVANMPRMSDPDAELGWVSRPGTYRYRHTGRSIQTTIQSDGARGSVAASGVEEEVWFFG